MTLKSVMIIEDDESIRELLVDFLEHEGIAATSAENGAVGLEKLKSAQDKPCLILLDIMMPVMDGLKFYSLMKSDPQLAGTPVVMMTANPSLVDRTIRDEVDHFLIKPINLDSLLKLLANYVQDEGPKVQRTPDIQI